MLQHVSASPPSAAEEDDSLLQERLRLSRRLRKQRLLRERQGGVVTAPLLASQPDIYFEHGPDGTYPIIAFRTVPCDLYVKGHCAPCSYSARPYPSGIGRAAIHASVDEQLDWILKNFDALFTRRASGELRGYRLHGDSGKPRYMMQLAGESSFFRDAEIPPDYRRRILERLDAFARERDIVLHVMLECRSEHLVAAHDSGELDELRPLLERLNVVVNMGLESVDDWVRQNVFMKNLPFELFARSIDIANAYGLDPGVFIYPCHEILAPSEMLQELDRNLQALENMGVFVNVMMANLQPWTIPDVLYEGCFWSLPEPDFLLDVLQRLLAYAPKRTNPVTPFSWFLGGLVSDPPPRGTILKHPRMATDRKVAKAVHSIVRQVVMGNAPRRLEQAFDELRQKCHPTPHSRVEEMHDVPAPARLRQATRFATAFLESRGYAP